MNILYIIPARGGSKGIPGKNIKMLGGKPLICHSIEIARQLAKDEDICVTTDDSLIIAEVEKMGLHVPFVRPAELATDTAGSYEVILHALHFFEKQGKVYDAIVLLQPTSPFRKPEFVKEAIALYNNSIDQVVSVVETKSNPYYILFEEDSNGFLQKSKQGNFTRRQDCPKVYEYNGSIYVMNVNSLKKKNIGQFNKVVKYVMEAKWSIDLDTPLDWEFAEFLYSKGHFDF
jgi:N-acylneuraminate cytidylyltransferase